MPSIEHKTLPRDDGICFPNLCFIPLHFEVCSLAQCRSELAKSSFNRILGGNGTTINQLQQQIYPKIKQDFISIVYKRQLKEELRGLGLDFDAYRAGGFDTREINERFGLPRNKRIYLHECDYMDFKSQSLTTISRELTEDIPFFYQYYNADELETKFLDFIYYFKVDLELSMRYDLDIDARMKYTNVFTRTRFSVYGDSL
ncbi:hypothetical protein CLIB1444_06S07184 [[Candida] jaroonii]|uniref:Uncharacterized protein n=1 Tax=[Candida] jaroonii TaxID=467808 RepID=A0ACA9YAE2_9ASCO|nr:hypothetical protein CLIB1444_06S07184 [[Candida] jaroonii]